MGEFKKVILPILGMVAFICLVGIWYKKQPNSAPATTTEVTLNNVKVKAEIAQTETQRQRGLSGREKLEENSGMLFVFAQSDPIPTFWMKGMKFDLDIIWIKKGKIIQIDKNVQPPAADTADNQLIRYSPKTAVDYVLEVNAGFSETNKIKIGDSFQIQSGQ